MKFDIENLLKLNLIKKIPESKEKAEQSITAAESWIKEAENNFQSESLKSCILVSYLAMFHAARGILFNDGFREKSHFAVARYLEDKYAKTDLLEKKWINLLDHYREIRHEDQYRTIFIATKEEARNALDSAIKFVERIKELLKTIS